MMRVFIEVADCLLACMQVYVYIYVWMRLCTYEWMSVCVSVFALVRFCVLELLVCLTFAAMARETGEEKAAAAAAAGLAKVGYAQQMSGVWLRVI